jgi:hypothetical protein
MNYNILKILDHYGIPYQDIPYQPDEVDFLCPFHEDTNFGSARFNTEDGIWRCFACPDGGNIFQFVAQKEGCSITFAEKLISSNFTATGDYNLDSLKGRLQNFYESHSRVSKRKKFTEHCIGKMVRALCRKKVNRLFLGRWYPIFAYYSSDIRVEDSTYMREILDVYSIFFQELNMEDSSNVRNPTMSPTTVARSTE